MNLIVIILLGLAAFSGIALRSVELANGNFVFTFDQGADLLAAARIIAEKKLTLIGAEAGGGYAGLPGVFHGPGYRYILAAVSFFSDGNPYGAMAVLWIFQMLTAGVLYMTARKVFSPVAGLVTVFIFLISPACIGMSRVIWAPNYAGLGIAVYLYILLTEKRDGMRRAAVLSFIAASLYHFEIPYAVAAMLSAALYVWFIEKRRSWRIWIAGLAGSVVGVMPMILFEIRHGWMIVRGLHQFLTNPSVVTMSSPFDISGNIRTLAYAINTLFPPVSGLAVWFWPAVCCVCIIWALQRKTSQKARNGFAGLLCILFAHVLVFVPYRNPVYGHYLVVSSFSLILMVAYIIQEALKTHMRIIAWGFVSALALFALLLYPRTIIADYHDYGGTVKIKGKTDAIDVIYRMADSKPFSLLVFTPPVYPYAYEYLLQWYAKKIYGYLPGTEKKGDVYLLMEPDPAKPWSYKGWLETVIVDGKIVDTVKLPSGFIIEKRRF